MPPIRSTSLVPSGAVDCRRAPVEVACALAPVALPLLFGMSSAPTAVLVALLVPFIWGLVRLARDRRLSRVALVTVLSPLAFGATAASVYGTFNLVNLLVGSGAGIPGLLLMVGATMAAMGGVAAAVARFVARRDPAHARVLLYLQALPVLYMLGSSPLGDFADVWQIVMCGLWTVLTGRYLNGAPAERIGRRMRAWVGASALLFPLVCLLYCSGLNALAGIIITLGMTLPWLRVDASLEQADGQRQITSRRNPS